MTVTNPSNTSLLWGGRLVCQTVSSLCSVKTPVCISLAPELEVAEGQHKLRLACLLTLAAGEPVFRNHLSFVLIWSMYAATVC